MKSFKLFIFTFLAMIATSAFAIAQGATQKTDNSKIISVKVKGITCSMDLKTIAANLEKLQGVSSCKSTKGGATSVFDVAFNPLLISEKEIYKVIENTGGCENPNDRPYKVKL